MTAEQIVEALCDAQREAVFAANPTGPYDGHKYELAAAHRDAIKAALVAVLDALDTKDNAKLWTMLEEACRK